MLLDVRELAVAPGPEDIASHFAEFVGRGLMLVGPPNVGKTTVLREVSRLLSLSDELIVTVVSFALM